MRGVEGGKETKAERRETAKDRDKETERQGWRRMWGWGWETTRGPERG